jgi:hypothetical protein
MIRSNKFLYSTLAFLATGASLQAIMFPKWPVATALPKKQIETDLQRSGLILKPLDTFTAQRNYDIASSEALRFSMENRGELAIRRSTVREFLNFRADYINEQGKELALVNSKPSSDPRFIEGTIGTRTALQTCMVEDIASIPPILGVTFKQLGEPIANQKVDSLTALKRFAGIEPNRDYSCLLITLLSDPDKPISPAKFSQLISKISPYLHHR